MTKYCSFGIKLGDENSSTPAIWCLKHEWPSLALLSELFSHSQRSLITGSRPESCKLHSSVRILRTYHVYHWNRQKEFRPILYLNEICRPISSYRLYVESPRYSLQMRVSLSIRSKHPNRIAIYRRLKCNELPDYTSLCFARMQMSLQDVPATKVSVLFMEPSLLILYF